MNSKHSVGFLFKKFCQLFLPIYLVLVLSGCRNVGAIIMADAGPPSLERSVRRAEVIVIGTVAQVLPDRWSTPHGFQPLRSSEGQASYSYDIFKPVTIEVEEYVKGKEEFEGAASEDNLLYIARPGGQVFFIIRNYNLQYHTFEEGQRVIVFLRHWAHVETVPTENLPQWEEIARYIIVDGQVQLFDDTEVSVQEFLERVRRAEENRLNSD